MEKLREMLMKEIDAVESKGKLDYNLLDMVGKVVDVIKDLHEIECMDMKLEGYSESGGDRGYYIEPYYRGASYHWKRPESTPYNPQYYRTEESEDKYHKMLEEAKSDEERELIKRLMDMKKH